MTELADKSEAMSTREDALKDVVVTNLSAAAIILMNLRSMKWCVFLEETEHLPGEENAGTIKAADAVAERLR